MYSHKFRTIIVFLITFLQIYYSSNFISETDSDSSYDEIYDDAVDDPTFLQPTVACRFKDHMNESSSFPSRSSDSSRSFEQLHEGTFDIRGYDKVPSDTSIILRVTQKSNFSNVKMCI